MRAPSDLALEEHVVGAVLAGWLDVELVPPRTCYRPVHERIMHAVRCADTLTRGYEARDHGDFAVVVLALGGLDLDVPDLDVAEQLATVAPVATVADVDVLVDLARRRRVLREMAEMFDAIWLGVDIAAALGQIADVAQLVDA